LKGSSVRKTGSKIATGSFYATADKQDYGKLLLEIKLMLTEIKEQLKS
jgi:hypothetical protein